MANSKNVFGLCDICGFRYRLNQLKKTSYGSMVCPTDYDGAYDLKNHPQNKPASLREDPSIRNARIDDTGRALTWEQASFTWDDTTQDRWWQTI